MATKNPNKQKNVEDLKGLTKRQDNIIRLRNKLNEKNPNAIKPFTTYKVITYVFDIVFPPYALYRIWCKKSTFTSPEKMVQSAVCVLYMIVLATTVFK